MVTASNAEPGALYVIANPTRRIAGEHFFVHEDGLRERLERTNCTGREAWLLGRLVAGWLPFWRVDRFEDSTTGSPFETRVPVAMPPDTELLRIDEPPAMRKAGEGPRERINAQGPIEGDIEFSLTFPDDPDYSTLGDQFYAETGIVAPGKDIPPGMPNQPDIGERMDQFAEWLRRRALPSDAPDYSEQRESKRVAVFMKDDDAFVPVEADVHCYDCGLKPPGGIAYAVGGKLPVRCGACHNAHRSVIGSSQGYDVDPSTGGPDCAEAGNYSNSSNSSIGPEPDYSRLIGPLREPGVYDDISNEDYHAGGELSATGLKVISARSVEHYIEQRRNPKQTATLDVGHCVHALLLEGREAFEAVHVRRPEEFPDFRTKAAREWRDEQTAAGHIILDDETADRIEAAAAAVRAHPYAANVLDTGRAETSVYWLRDVGGVEVPCRCRPDWLVKHGDAHIVFDLKTARDASAAEFAKAAARYGYHVQAAHYIDGLTSAGFDIVAWHVLVVETEAPYGVALYRLGDDWLDRGREIADEALERVATWLTCDDEDLPATTGYPLEIRELIMPRWA